LPSGLRYITIKPGVGAPAVPGRSVSVHYTGYLAENGTQFDTSFREDPRPLVFVLNATGPNAPIRGFNDGIIGMNVGGRRRLIIPANLAYGEAGNPPRVPANADLIFDVELFSVSSR
jgi:peptidylprolyl isomerase